jgi:hypothetical protein
MPGQIRQFSTPKQGEKFKQIQNKQTVFMAQPNNALTQIL